MDEVDPERDTHLLELGRAIAEWAKAEEQLYFLVHQLLGCTMRRAAIVFYKTPTLETRLQLADELLKTVFPQPSDSPGSHHHPGYVAWKAIQADIREALPFRNRLAHEPVEPRAPAWKDEASDDWVIGAMKIVTATSIGKALHKPGDPAIGVEEIKTHTAKIAEFPERIVAFRSGPLATQLQALAAQSPSRYPN